MTYLKNDFRLSSLADGTTMTVANSGNPDAFSALVTSNGATVVYEATPRTAIFSGPDTGVARGDWTINTARAEIEALFDFSGIASSADNRILALFNTGQNAGFGVNLVSGALRVINFAGATQFTTTQTVYGKRVRVYFAAEIGTGTADGELHFDAFFGPDADGTTPSASSSFHSSTANAGTVNFTAFRVGKIGSGNLVSVPVEYVHADDTKYVPALGPLTAVSAPVITFTKQTVVEVDSNLSGTATVTLTTAAGSAVTPTSITGPDANGVFRVALPDPMTGAATLTLKAVNGGGTSTKTVTIDPIGSKIVQRDFLTWNGSAFV